MTAADTSTLRRWLFAAKPASWPKLLVPFVLGQAIGLGGGARPSLDAALFGLAFTVLDLLFIVFLNDWGDREVDAIKRRMFPQTSAKTIPDRVLPSGALLAAGILAGLAAIAVAFVAERSLDRPGLGVAGVGALAIFAAYTLPPLRMNYRGGGELLELLGVGVALPWLHAYVQGGSWLAPRGLALLPGFALLSLAGAIASGLSDERSDRAGGKRTVVTTIGNEPARRLIELASFAGASAWALAGMLSERIPLWLGVAPALVAFWYAGGLLAISGSARTDEFAAHRRYKAQLHRAMWRGALVAAMLLAWLHRVPGN